MTGLIGSRCKYSNVFSQGVLSGDLPSLKMVNTAIALLEQQMTKWIKPTNGNKEPRKDSILREKSRRIENQAGFFCGQKR